jgi:ribonuclease H2 subunit B
MSNTSKSPTPDKADIQFQIPINLLCNRTAAQIAASAPITQSKSEAALKAGVKRKAAPGSRGVESLKKVNTSSMSKLTSFFKPKEGKK